MLKTFLYLQSQLRKEALTIIAMESCLSGRKDLFAKQAYGKLYQGFESCRPDFFLLFFLKKNFYGCVAFTAIHKWVRSSAG